MSLVLNTNIDSLIAQGSLTSSGMQLATALQQLSSGLRVNTAADDAAGFAIAQGMTSQINGLNQASQNANDGVSLTQTASGALSEVTNDLQTMRDLAVESLNATNSSGDRTDLNSQFSQLLADINSVAANTQFNGVNLLDGTFQGATFQIGANAGQTITVAAVSSSKASNLGSLYTVASGNDYTAANVTAGDTGTVAVTDGNGNVFTTGTITLTGNQATDLKTIVAAINQATGSDGIVATVDATGKQVQLSSTASQAITLAYTPATGTEAEADVGLATSYDLTGATATNLDTAGVTTVDSSNQALIQIDAALQQLATTSAQLGAYQNRFQAAITGLNTDSTNLTSAKSAIVDTDYAQATSNLSKAQILQQASTAMVAQANTIPQNILTLLQKLP